RELERSREVAAEFNCSLAELWLSCWQVLLSRLSGAAEVTVGVCGDGRNEAEVERALGLLSRYVPVSSSCDEGKRFSQVVAELSGSCRNALEWQEAFAWQDGAQLNGNNSIPPFHPLSYEYEEWPSARECGEVRFSMVQLWSCFDRYLLKLSCA